MTLFKNQNCMNILQTFFALTWEAVKSPGQFDPCRSCINDSLGGSETEVSVGLMIPWFWVQKVPQPGWWHRLHSRPCVCCQAPFLPIFPILPDGSFPRAGQVSSPACAELLWTKGAHCTALGSSPGGSLLSRTLLWTPAALLSPDSYLHLLNSVTRQGSTQAALHRALEILPVTQQRPPQGCLLGMPSLRAHCPSLPNVQALKTFASVYLPFLLFLSSFRCFVCVCTLCFCGVCRLLQVEGQIQFLLLHLGQEQKMY